jgi:glycosyltransferase involved in cell wall biosynthesis
MIIVSPKFVSNPTISVFVITYNQENTIAQTIESILMQEGDFELELIIGEDASSDATKTICKAYQQKYPQIIKLLLQDTNQGLVKNYIETQSLCRGQYVALCAGDDYWIDKYKLKKQILFLESNVDCGVVSTNGYRLYVKSNKFVEGIAPLNPVLDGEVFPLTYIGGVYAMPLSLMYKRELLQYIDFDQFILRKFSCEDVPIQAIMAKHTKFGHIPDLTCVYRVHDKSMTFTSFYSANFLHYHEGLVAIKRYLNELYPGEVGFTEEWANDYLAYKKFLLAVSNFGYTDAKKQLSILIKITSKEQKALNYSKTLVGFYTFCLAKRIKMWYHEKKHS